jgi:hypothetical protein
VIEITPAVGQSAHTSALKPISVISMSSVAEPRQRVCEVMTYGTDVKPVIELDMDNVKVTNNDLNTSVEQPEN